MSARTGGIKGALSVHSWLVLKREGASEYERYDVVGWGRPVRKNAYAADARWYSNPPQIIFRITGQMAQRAIPGIDRAIANYPASRRGDYVIWPGPNSNTFVAHIIRSVPELATQLPPTAIGKDYLLGSNWIFADNRRWLIKLSASGYAGLTLGLREGFEAHILGLVVGIDWFNLQIKLPGIGSFPNWSGEPSPTT